MSVLEHLGLNLYSNLPAVIGEAVANAWDADAARVDISIDVAAGVIHVKDDGIGMTHAEINQKYLWVGYHRREHGAKTKTLKGRHVMGRKGIGKLSLFAIADAIELRTVKRDGNALQRSGLIMRADDIRRVVEANSGTYRPVAIEPTDFTFRRGTEITLRDLRVSSTELDVAELRKRLARRFTVISKAVGFEVVVNGKRIGPADRDYQSSVEYLWTIGPMPKREKGWFSNAKRITELPNTLKVGELDFKIGGWVGTAERHQQLAGGNNAITVLAWGKVAHEDILKDISAGGLYTKYVVGELNANFLDEDKLPDIATSDRQRVKESDPRFAALRKYIATDVLRPIENSWRDWRQEEGAAAALGNEAIKSWFATLKPEPQRYARQLLGKIGSFPLDDEGDRRELYRHGILAFERLRQKEALQEIDKIESQSDLDKLARVFVTLDDFEAIQYYDISKSRVAIIDKLTELTTIDAKERMLQEHLFNHLWLLDPSWDRATAADNVMEARIARVFKSVRASKEELTGRIDIAYRTAAGKHVIIELKRYGTSVSYGQLVDQLGKYRSAVEKYLKERLSITSPDVELVSVLGSNPTGTDATRGRGILGQIGARVVKYDELIVAARKSYEAYLDANKGTSSLRQILDRV